MARERIVEIGGWALLAAALAWLMYVLFHKIQIVTTKLGGAPVGASVEGKPVPPETPPVRPDQPASYVDNAGYSWLWNPEGKQWFIAPDVGRQLRTIQ